MISLNENINLFLSYLDKNRGYATTSLSTYRIALMQIESCSHYYVEDEKIILDITPFRLKIVNDSKKTISKKLSAVRSLVKFMKEQKALSVTLLGDSMIKVPKTLPKPIEEKIIKEVLSKSSRKELLIITLLYGLGLRISELADIRLDAIGSHWIKIQGKGGKEREIPLHEEIRKEVVSYLKVEHPKEFLFEKKNKAMNGNQLRYLVQKSFKENGVKLTPHQLRHSFATHLLHNGARISDVSKLLGHKSMVSTQIYTKLEKSKKLNEYTHAHPLCDIKNL